eukprot:11160171-Lingulodinium_polyedra.AAC.1
MCAQGTARGLRLLLQRAPRASNEAADAFGDLSFEEFNEALLAPLEPGIPFAILGSLLLTVGEFQEAVERPRAGGGAGPPR